MSRMMRSTLPCFVAFQQLHFPVYFKAQPVPGAGKVEMEICSRSETRAAVTLHVEIYNPNGTIPLIVTLADGDTNGFGGLLEMLLPHHRTKSDNL